MPGGLAMRPTPVAGPSTTEMDCGEDPHSSARSDERLFLLSRVGTVLVALPASAVERVIPMAALTPLPDAPSGIVGVLDLGGEALVVLDARPRLGQPTPGFDPDQRLIVVAASRRFLLWVDAVEEIASARPGDLDAMLAGRRDPLTPYVARLQGRVVPVLAPEALDPDVTDQQESRGHAS